MIKWQKLILSPTSMTFNGWQRTSIPIYTEFYFFNVTNPQSILTENKKPILEEIGISQKQENLKLYNRKLFVDIWCEAPIPSESQLKRWIYRGMNKMEPFLTKRSENGLSFLRKQTAVSTTRSFIWMSPLLLVFD